MLCAYANMPCTGCANVTVGSLDMWQGTMSAAFCGVEVLARECRGGTQDKWNNMFGACSAGCVGNLGKGPGISFE